MKATFKTITIKSHEQTMDEFAAICDAAIEGEQVKPEEPLARQLSEANAHAGIAVLARFGLRKCEQLLHRLCRQRRIHDHHLRRR